ncbi:MAG: ferritin family protein [Dehalococcoidales bacterium]|nr:ferritin family protein [Dehalococcoidales bacterium]
MSDIEKAMALFDKAMETEAEGLKVYEDAAARVKDPRAKEIFSLLAEAERGHMEQIEKAKNADIAAYSSKEWRGSFVSKLNQEIEDIGRLKIPAISDVVTDDATALDAITMGIKLEKESIEFYDNARKQVSDIGIANLFSTLLSTERIHLFLLENHKDIIMGISQHS